MFLAGEVSLSPASRVCDGNSAGSRWDGDVVVIGAGPEGRRCANEAAAEGRRVCLISRSSQPGSFASAFGTALPPLHGAIKTLFGHEAVGVYRAGRVVLAAPKQPEQAPTVLVSKELVLAIGRYSLPPLVPGHDLPGVFEVRAALQWARKLGADLGPVVVVGTAGLDKVAGVLESLGVTVVGVEPVTDLVEILGDRAVQGVRFSASTIRCRALVHAGPWVTDHGLAFQASAKGELRLMGGIAPSGVSVHGAALGPDERVTVAPLDTLGDTAICPCMDVTVGEVRAHIRAGVKHIEVLKRSTSCGMGPCQGIPCWEHLRAVVSAELGVNLTDFPTHRPPRRGLTVGQAAAVDGLLELE